MESICGDIQVTEEWLRDHDACSEGVTWWLEHGEIADVDSLMQALAEHREFRYGAWLAAEAEWTGVVNTTRCERRYYNGLLSCDDGPAETYYHKNGSVEMEKYYRNDQVDRADGPAIIIYRRDGSVEKEKYYRNYQLDRIDGPAIIWYRRDGTIKCVDYWRGGRRSRDNGPAVIWYGEDGTVVDERYYLGGLEVSREAVMGDEK
jgi:hypothetical protein